MQSYELNPADIIDEEDLEESVADPTSALKKRGEGKILSSIIGSLGSGRGDTSAKNKTEKSSIATTAKGSLKNSPEKPTLPNVGVKA